MFKEKIIYIVFSLFVCLFCIEPLYAQQKISAKQAWEDIDTYFFQINKLHPNMYWNTTDKVIKEFVDSLKLQCKDSIDIATFSYLLAQSNHFFDYHTNCLLSVETSSNVFFPFLEFKSSGMYWKGQQINFINYVSVDRIISQIKKCMGADIPWEVCCFELNNSTLAQRVMVSMGLQPPFKLCINNSDSLYQVEGISFNLLNQQISNKLSYSFECFPEESVAIIHYNQCIMSGHEKFEQFLQKSFAEVQRNNINYLFIDISRNAGGDSNTSTMFLNYIYFPKCEKYIYIGKIKNDRNQLRKEKNRVIVPASSSRKNKFTGTIFVYQSYATRSAGPFLGEFLRSMSRAILVGTETEATIPAYSNALWQKLPFSGLHYCVARDYYYKERRKIPRNKMGGVLPDIIYPFVELKLEHCLDIINLYKCNKIR